jgi:arsenate reductase
MLIASWAYFRYQGIKTIQSLFTGLGALVVALLVNATLKLGQSVLKPGTGAKYKDVLIAGMAFLAFYFGRANVIALTLGAGLLGLVFYAKEPDENAKEYPGEAAAHKEVVQKPYAPLLATGIIALGMITFPLSRRMFATFFGIGTFAFGGGFAAIPLIQSRVVGQLHWLNLAQFRDGIALGQVTPGPVFITATFIGYKVMGWVGAFIATVAIFMPSLAAMIALSDMHDGVKHIKPVRAVIRGFLAGFIGLLAAVTLQFALKSLVGWRTWLVFAGSLAIAFPLKAWTWTRDLPGQHKGNIQEREVKRATILFLCTGNSARSQMAEGLLRRMAGDRFEVHSAGTRPVGLNPNAVSVMREIGIDISGQRSKRVDEFAGQQFDYVFTVCDNAREACPFFPGGGQRIHHSFEDPAGAPEDKQMDVFRRVRDEIKARLEQFVRDAE